MKWKNLIPLIGVFVILLGLVVLRQSREEQISLEDAVALPRMIPDEVDRASIARLEFHVGFAPEDQVVVERDPERPDMWVVASHYHAPADQTKVADFITMLERLRGELRESDTTQPERYGLDDKDAFYITGFVADAETPAFTLLVGRQAQENQTFIRKADSNDVYLVNRNPKRDAGIWRDDPPETPTATPWLDRGIIDVDSDAIERLEMTSPYKRLVFARGEELPVETPDPDIPNALDPEADGFAPPAPEEPIRTWTLEDGGPGTEFKHPGIDAIARALDNLRAVEIVDPATPETWGLDAPPFACTVTLAGLEEPLVIEGGRPDPTSDGYVRVTGREREVIYQLNKTSFERIFGLGRSADLFDLDGFDMASADIRRVEVDQPEGPFVLARNEDDAWTVESPHADFDLQQNTIDAVVSGLANWEPADYVDTSDDTGLDQPLRTLTVTTDDGASHTLRVGLDSPYFDGAYAQKEGEERPYLMARSDLNRLFPEPNALYVRRFFEITEFDIASVTVERENDAFSIQREDDAWWIIIGEERYPADADRVEYMLFTLSDLEAMEIRFGQTELDTEAIAGVRFTTIDGEEYRLEIGSEAADQHAMLASHLAQLCMVDAFDIDDILPVSTTLIADDPEDAVIEEEPEPALEDPAIPFEEMVPGSLPLEGLMDDETIQMLPVE